MTQLSRCRRVTNSVNSFSRPGVNGLTQPRKALPLLALLGLSDYFRGPVGKPSARSIDAIDRALSFDTPRSFCSHSETVSFVGAVPGSVGSYNFQKRRAAASMCPNISV